MRVTRAFWFAAVVAFRHAPMNAVSVWWRHRGSPADCLEAWRLLAGDATGDEMPETSGDMALKRSAPRSLAAMLRLVRPSQWLKNSLVMVPVLTSHRWQEVEVWVAAGLAFVVLSLAASAVYAVNDVLDWPEDRLHPFKRERPVAVGALEVGTALLLALGCALAALALAAWLPAMALAGLLGYWCLSAGYLLGWKRRLGWDVVVLTLLHVLRIAIGGWATGIGVSWWLLGFAVTFFGGLALLKRYAELRLWRQYQTARTPGRAYQMTHLPAVHRAGISLSLLSALWLTAYIFSPQARLLYLEPLWLLGAVVGLALWERMLWRRATMDRLRGDPLQEAFLIPMSYLCGLLVVVGVVLAKV